MNMKFLYVPRITFFGIIIYLKMVDKCLNGAFRISFRLGPSIGTQAFIAIQKGFIRSPISESSATDSQILH